MYSLIWECIKMAQRLFRGAKMQWSVPTLRSLHMDISPIHRSSSLNWCTCISVVRHQSSVHELSSPCPSYDHWSWIEVTLDDGFFSSHERDSISITGRTQFMLTHFPSLSFIQNVLNKRQLIGEQLEVRHC